MYKKALVTAAVVGDTTKFVSVIRVGPLTHSDFSH